MTDNVDHLEQCFGLIFLMPIFIFVSIRHVFELENGVTLTLKHHSILSATNYFVLVLFINIFNSNTLYMLYLS